MVYANGDYGNCGGISIGRLNSDMLTWQSGSLSSVVAGRFRTVVVVTFVGPR